MDARDKKNLLFLVTRLADLIDQLTDAGLASGFGSDFGAVFPVGATPLSATASKNRSMTVLPRRRFDSEICSFGKCA